MYADLNFELYFFLYKFILFSMSYLFSMNHRNISKKQFISAKKKKIYSRYTQIFEKDLKKQIRGKRV